MSKKKVGYLALPFATLLPFATTISCGAKGQGLVLGNQEVSSQLSAYDYFATNISQCEAKILNPTNGNKFSLFIDKYNSKVDGNPLSTVFSEQYNLSGKYVNELLDMFENINESVNKKIKTDNLNIDDLRYEVSVSSKDQSFSFNVYKVQTNQDLGNFINKFKSRVAYTSPALDINVGYQTMVGIAFQNYPLLSQRYHMGFKDNQGNFITDETRAENEFNTFFNAIDNTQEAAGGLKTGNGQPILLYNNDVSIIARPALDYNHGVFSLILDFYKGGKQKYSDMGVDSVENPIAHSRASFPLSNVIPHKDPAENFTYDQKKNEFNAFVDAAYSFIKASSSSLPLLEGLDPQLKVYFSELKPIFNKINTGSGVYYEESFKEKWFNEIIKNPRINFSYLIKISDEIKKNSGNNAMLTRPTPEFLTQETYLFYTFIQTSKFLISQDPSLDNSLVIKEFVEKLKSNFNDKKGKNVESTAIGANNRKMYLAGKEPSFSSVLYPFNELIYNNDYQLTNMNYVGLESENGSTNKAQYWPRIELRQDGPSYVASLNKNSSVILDENNFTQQRDTNPFVSLTFKKDVLSEISRESDLSKIDIAVRGANLKVDDLFNVFKYLALPSDKELRKIARVFWTNDNIDKSILSYPYFASSLEPISTSAYEKIKSVLESQVSLSDLTNSALGYNISTLFDNNDYMLKIDLWLFSHK